MAWKQLTIEDLRLVLAEDEVQKLENYSTQISAIVNSQLDTVADMFRGAWLAKGYEIDYRDHYVAPEYVQPVLNYARWQIWTRFPMTEQYSLSDPRKLSYEEAQELLKNPYIGTSKPDYSDDPEYDPSKAKQGDPAIKLPFLKFDSPFSGFLGTMEREAKAHLI